MIFEQVDEIPVRAARVRFVMQHRDKARRHLDRGDRPLEVCRPREEVVPDSERHALTAEVRLLEQFDALPLGSLKLEAPRKNANTSPDPRHACDGAPSHVHLRASTLQKSD